MQKRKDMTSQTDIVVTVRMFAGAAETFGARNLSVKLALGSTVESAFTHVTNLQPRMSRYSNLLRFAVNHEFADPTRELEHGDELALIPPVSGG